MQKKLKILSLIVVLALALTACSSAAATTIATENSSAANTSVATDSSLDDVANQSLQLALGVMNLRSTEYQIDATQSTALVPLFQNLQTLLNSDAYSASQVQSALDAIKAALSADQLQAITDMGTLTLDNLTMGGRGGQMNGTPDPSMALGTPGAGGAGGPGGDNGQMPQGTPGTGGPGGDGQGGGTPPDMNGTPAEGGNAPVDMQATIESIKSSSVTPGLNPDLIGLVIANLQMVK
jgi:hypothetical protein